MISLCTGICKTRRSIIIRRGLLPASWQETFWSPASRLSVALKSPANRLAGDLKVIGILMNKEIAV